MGVFFGCFGEVFVLFCGSVLFWHGHFVFMSVSVDERLQFLLCC